MNMNLPTGNTREVTGLAQFKASAEINDSGNIREDNFPAEPEKAHGEHGSHYYGLVFTPRQLKINEALADTVELNVRSGETTVIPVLPRLDQPSPHASPAGTQSNLESEGDPKRRTSHIIHHKDEELRAQCVAIRKFLGRCHENFAVLAEKLGIATHLTRAQEHRGKSSQEQRDAQCAVEKELHAAGVGYVGGYPRYLSQKASVALRYREILTVDLSAIYRKQCGFDKSSNHLREYSPERLGEHLAQSLSSLMSFSRYSKQQTVCFELLTQLSEIARESMPRIANLALEKRDRSASFVHKKEIEKWSSQTASAVDGLPPVVRHAVGWIMSVRERYLTSSSLFRPACS